MAQPTSEADRIQSLDILRGFALLGILLLNILGFGLSTAALANPGYDLTLNWDANLITFVSVDLLFEGAMRCLFSILFGAGVVLFLTGDNAKSGWIHYKRNFWLLVFGLFDAYILLWNGDILVNYALCGAFLFLLRNKSATTLNVLAGLVIVVTSFVYAVMLFGLSYLQDEAQLVATTEDPTTLSEQTLANAKEWDLFLQDYDPGEAAMAEEISQRQNSYLSAFKWNLETTNEMMLFVLPLFLIWDALAMMLIGMALYKAGILQGARSMRYYTGMMIIGFTVGLSINTYELYQSLSSNFDLLKSMNLFKPTYHVGRLGMAFGYLGLVMVIIKSGALSSLLKRLTSVGRMALTNYLMHSLICLIIFTGAGFALVGQLERWVLYLVVLAIWIFQLWFSHWWLARYRFGPVEWLWRTLTYGERPSMQR